MTFHDQTDDPRCTRPDVLLRCPACGDEFFADDSGYSLDLLTNDGALRHVCYLLCRPCSVCAVRGGRPARRLIRRAVQKISGVVT